VGISELLRSQNEDLDPEIKNKDWPFALSHIKMHNTKPYTKQGENGGKTAPESSQEIGSEIQNPPINI
jgi:hypothetical protein